MEGILNGLSFSILLTALYTLRFRGWTRPWAVLAYFVFFAGLEMGASRYFLPAGAFGPALTYVCLFLTLPVLVAAYLVYRQEQKHDSKRETEAVALDEGKGEKQ